MPGFRADLAYEKHPRVAIRLEEFGGLAYHYDTRRLLFLKSRALVDVVESLASYPTAGDALTACFSAGCASAGCASAGCASVGGVRADCVRADCVRADQAAACAAALPRLLAADVIRVRATG